MTRRLTLTAALILAACTADLPTEPTGPYGSGFQAALPPIPAPPTELIGTLPGASGAPATIQLGFWESPTLAQITVSGVLSYSGMTGGFYAGSASHDYQGRWLPFPGRCASQLSVRIAGYGPVGGAFGYCPATWQGVGSHSNYAIVSGQVYADRTSPGSDACYYGGNPCASISGSQTVTVTPLTGVLQVVPETTVVNAGAHTYVRFRASPGSVGGIGMPFTLWSIEFEGEGEVVSPGGTNPCGTRPKPTECIGQFRQSGYVVGKGLVNGVFREGRAFIEVRGGAKEPVDTVPADTIPTDTIPTDTIPGGGGGGGGGGDCVQPAGAPAALALSESDCEETNDTIIGRLALSRVNSAPLLVERSFDAVRQENFITNSTGVRTYDRERRLTTASRPDTVTVRVTTRRMDDNRPVGGVPVLLEAFAVAQSGGHSHNGGVPRPVGDFFLPSEDTQVQGSSGRRGAIAGITDSMGVLVVVYRSSGLAGEERIVLKTLTDSPIERPAGPPDTLGFFLRLRGMVEMASSMAGLYEYKSARNPGHHGQGNRWVTPGLRDSVIAVFREYFRLGGAINDPDAGNRFVITDAGLEWGGLNDASSSSEWSSPHQTHRVGNDMDVRIRRPNGTNQYVQVMSDEEVSLLREICEGYEKVPRRVLRCTPEPPPAGADPHIHIEGL